MAIPIHSRTPLVLLAIGIAGAYIAFHSFPGTEDVATFWTRWSDLVSTRGLRDGYREAFADYPPGMFILFKIAHSTFEPVPAFALVKGTIAWAVVASLSVYAAWSRSLGWTIALAAALLLSSSVLGYMDVLYLAPLLAGLWSLQSERIFLGSFWFGMTVMLKWQAVIIAPFFMAQAAGFSLAEAGLLRTWGTQLLRATAGMMLPVVACLLIVDPPILWRAFTLATSHSALSLQGLNANWLIALWLHAEQGGKHVYDTVAPAGLTAVMRTLFYLGYSTVFAIFLLRRRSFAEFAWFGCVGFLMYFLLNVGVHENHLFVPMVMSFVLVCTHRSGGRALVAFLTVAANFNLLLFYGIEGRMLLAGSNMLLASAVLASINTLFGAWCFVGVVQSARRIWRTAASRP